jgi:prevent-host-death family protein
MEQMAFRDIRTHFTEVANKVQYAKQRYILTKNNHPALAIVPIDDVKLLNRLITRLEDREDLKKYAARKHEKTSSLDELWRELGIDL